MNIDVKIEGLDKFTEALALLASAVGVNKDTSFTTPAPVTPAQEIADPAVPEVASELPQEEPQITLDQLRAAFAEKNTAENRKELKKIINSLGVEKLTALPEDKYGAALAALEAV